MNKTLNRENEKEIKNSNEELYLYFIDEERNKELEERFFLYINTYFNFGLKDKSDIQDSQDDEHKENNNE